jgi:transcriptional regulator with XRE-family HTH domain
MTEFGNYLKHAREKQSLSLSEAARLIGCTKSHLWDLEQGRSNNPTIKILAALACAYQDRLSYIVELAAICVSGLEHRTAVSAYMKARIMLSQDSKT